VLGELGGVNLKKNYTYTPGALKQIKTAFGRAIQIEIIHLPPGALKKVRTVLQG